MTKWYISILKANISNLKFKLQKSYLIKVEHLFILVSTVTVCVSVSAFASLVCVPVGITSFAVGIKICAMTEGIKKYKAVIMRTKKDDKILLLGRDKLNTIEVLIFKALIDRYISHNELVSVNNVLREYNEMKEKIKNPDTSEEYVI